MRWKLVTWLTIQATNMSDWLLRKRKWTWTAEDYRSLEHGTIGKELISYMDANAIPFKPNLVRHDLKHIVLGYKMNMPDELRIHAFLIGNRCFNPMAMIYLFLCIAIVPEIIPTLKKDFYRGRKSICLRKIHFEKHITENLDQFQKSWGLEQEF